MTSLYSIGFDIHKEDEVNGRMKASRVCGNQALRPWPFRDGANSSLS